MFNKIISKPFFTFISLLVLGWVFLKYQDSLLNIFYEGGSIKWNKFGNLVAVASDPLIYPSYVSGTVVCGSNLPVRNALVEIKGSAQQCGWCVRWPWTVRLYTNSTGKWEMQGEATRSPVIDSVTMYSISTAEYLKSGAWKKYIGQTTDFITSVLQKNRTYKQTSPTCTPPPACTASASPTSGEAPLTVNFTSSVTNTSSYSWNFGDGASSTAANPQHSYTAAETFSPKLTVTGDGGTASCNAPQITVNCTETGYYR